MAPQARAKLIGMRLHGNSGADSADADKVEQGRAKQVAGGGPGKAWPFVI